MKKWIMRGCVLVLAGIVLCSIGFALGGVTHEQGDYVKQEAAYAPHGVTKVQIAEKDADVKLGVSPDGDIHVTWYESDRNDYQITQNGAFTISREGGADWSNHLFNFGFLDFGRMAKSHPLTVLLPQGTQWEVEITSQMGDVAVTGGDYAGLTVKVDAGDIVVTELAAETLAATTDLGSLTVLEVTLAEEGVLDTKFGDVTAKQVTAGTLEGRANSGEISLTQVTGDEVAAESDFGDITLSEVTAVARLHGKSASGDVEVSEVSAGESIDLETSFGSIEGTVMGKLTDYTIDAKTDFGENNLPSVFQGGEVQLRAYTAAGDIEIVFRDGGSPDRR